MNMNMEVRKGCIYIELNGWTYYIDDTTNEQIMEKFNMSEFDSKYNLIEREENE